MKLWLFVDTETTGKNDFKKPYHDPCQPDIIQFCALLMDADEVRRGAFEFIVRPFQQPISPEATEIHKITPQICSYTGVLPTVALRVFANLERLANVLVAHNRDFDKMLIQTSCHRGGLQQISDRMETKPFLCTKEMGVPICKLPPNFPGAEYKWPTLDELHRHLFGKSFDGAHGALADTEACARCFFEIQRKYPNWQAMPRKPQGKR